jgi:heptosyltransferase-2
MKILIIKLGAIGDILATSPIFSALKNKGRDIYVYHLVLDSYKAGSEGNPSIDHQIVVNLKPGYSFQNFVELVKTLMILRKVKFDTAVILHRNFAFQVLCLFSGIRRIIGFTSSRNYLLDVKIPYQIDINRTVQEYNLLKLAGLITGGVPNKLEFYPTFSKVNEQKFEIFPAKYIACNPGGGNVYSSAKNRLWPVDSYAKLIELSPYPFVILGQGDADRLLVDELKSKAHKDFIDMVNMLSFDEAAIALKKSLLYVGNDSSLLFLAAAMGVSSIGLFGPTQVIAANPLGQKQFFIKSLANCSPCYDPRDGIKGTMYTCSNNICMQNISVDSVLSMIHSHINTAQALG